MKKQLWGGGVIASALMVAYLGLPGEPAVPGSYIVQAEHAEQAAVAVRSVGGEITHELGIIRAVGARLTAAQKAALESRSGVAVHGNRQVRTAATAGGDALYVEYPSLVRADLLHDEGVTGAGITVAFIDSGLNNASPALNYTADGSWRTLAAYNAIDDIEIDDLEENGFMDLSLIHI